MSSGPGAGQMPGASARRTRHSLPVSGITYAPGLSAMQATAQSPIGALHLVTAQRATAIAAEAEAAAAAAAAAAEAAARQERERARVQLQRELDEAFRVPDAVRKEFPHSKIVGSYLIGRTLGEGAFAKVRLALHHPSGQQVAVKVVSKEKVKLDAYMAKHFR